MAGAHQDAAMPDARCICNLTMAKWLRRHILGSCFFQYDHVVAGRGADSTSANAAFATEAAVTTNHDLHARWGARVILLRANMSRATDSGTRRQAAWVWNCSAVLHVVM